MRKTLLAILFAGTICTAKAQYGTMDQILTRLEERSGVNQNLESVNIDDKNLFSSKMRQTIWKGISLLPRETKPLT